VITLITSTTSRIHKDIYIYKERERYIYIYVNIYIKRYIYIIDISGKMNLSRNIPETVFPNSAHREAGLLP